MKPIILIKEKDVEEITILQEELKRIIDEAYEQGKKDGKEIIYYPTYPYPYWDYYRPWTITTTPNVTWTADSATCTSSSSASIPGVNTTLT